MEQKRTVLLSCLGTTDPIRGGYDGPMLHILRHHRPDIVVLFYTKEVRSFEESDHRFAIMRDYLEANWDYAPEWYEVNLGEKDPSDLTEMGLLLDKAMKPYLEKYASEEFLINLSSATPQMQIIMAQQAMDTRWNSRGIQVLIPSKKAGGDARNINSIDMNEMLENNWDELMDDLENRCVEPDLIRMRREEHWAKIEILLKQRDFGALMALGNIPVGGRKMLRHLYERNRLELTDARNEASSFPQNQFYPVAYLPGSVCETLCEYYLIMRNLQRTGRTSEFMVRFNPFIVELLKFYVDGILRKAPYNSSFNQISQTVGHGRRVVKPYLLQQVLGGMDYAKVDAKFNGGFREGDFSIALGCALLSEVFKPNQDIIDFFNICETLNHLRNDTAHKLQVTSEQDIRDQIGIGSRDLCDQIEIYMTRILRETYPQFTQAAFDKLYAVYDNGIEYIKKNR